MQSPSNVREMPSAPTTGGASGQSHVPAHTWPAKASKRPSAYLARLQWMFG